MATVCVALNASQVLIDERNEWMASYLWLQCDRIAPVSSDKRDTVFVIAGLPV